MLLKQLVHLLVVCSVSWPNCFCLVLFYLFIGSTLKRLCLGKERSSSNYLIYFLTLFSPFLSLSLYVHFIFSLFKKCKCWYSADCCINLHLLSFCMVVCLRVLVAEFCHCLQMKHNLSVITMKVLYVVILWLLCWQHMFHSWSCIHIYSAKP